LSAIVPGTIPIASIVADSAEATGLKWATPSSGGMTLISTTTLTGASVNLTSIPATYNNLQLVIRNFRPTTDSIDIRMRVNNISTNSYSSNLYGNLASSLNNTFGLNIMENITTDQDNGTSNALAIVNFLDYANTATWKIIQSVSVANNATTTTNFNFDQYTFITNQTAAISEINLLCSSGNFTSGTALLYGVK
jgi:hypothetical protein